MKAAAATDMAGAAHKRNRVGSPTEVVMVAEGGRTSVG
jgi:hypothetical protein